MQCNAMPMQCTALLYYSLLLHNIDIGAALRLSLVHSFSSWMIQIYEVIMELFLDYNIALTIGTWVYYSLRNFSCPTRAS